ncbi:hypothetical protein [Albidovulum sp.]
MKTAIVAQVVKLVLPALAGAAGAWLLTAFPEVHVAFCGVRK